MATMKRSKEEPEIPNSKVVMSMAGAYNSEVEAIREEEYPMLQGTFGSVLEEEEEKENGISTQSFRAGDSFISNLI